MKNIILKRNIDLFNYTTIKVGGCSEYFSEPREIKEFIDLVNWAKFNKLKCNIIGAGSNLLINNTFLKGLTICTKKMRSIKKEKNSGIVYAECGAMLPSLSSFLAKHSCQGGEWTIGIPGTLGGAIYMNAGSAKHSMCDYLVSVQVIDPKTLKIYEILKDNLNFKYRFSSFQNNNLIILKAKLLFDPKGDMQLITEKTKNNLKR